ncbi:heat-shock protein [Striga asiatica]|uniref:Heat-shock protein n=1 Tax=Striga asiatica TaxID=4170 RepID=A0A5A7PQ41_STRAF|nr:heat-shock protein [Striga asiatica]
MAVSLFLNRFNTFSPRLVGSLRPPTSVVMKRITVPVAVHSRTLFKAAPVTDYPPYNGAPDSFSDTDSGEDLLEDPRVICSFQGYGASDPFPAEFTVPYGSPEESDGSPVESDGYCLKTKPVDNGVHLRMYLPGVSKENVKVWVDGEKLYVKGTKMEFEDDIQETVMSYAPLKVPENRFKAKEIKAEMKDGVLKIFVPRIKDDERADHWTVEVE